MSKRCLRCGDDVSNLAHPHNCPGSRGIDRDRFVIEND